MGASTRHVERKFRKTSKKSWHKRYLKWLCKNHRDEVAPLIQLYMLHKEGVLKENYDMFEPHPYIVKPIYLLWFKEVDGYGYSQETYDLYIRAGCKAEFYRQQRLNNKLSPQADWGYPYANGYPSRGELPKRFGKFMCSTEFREEENFKKREFKKWYEKFGRYTLNKNVITRAKTLGIDKAEALEMIEELRNYFALITHIENKKKEAKKCRSKRVKTSETSEHT